MSVLLISMRVGWSYVFVKSEEIVVFCFSNEEHPAVDRKE